MSEDSTSPQIEIPCPHCAGKSQWNLLQTLNQCTYCGSVLSWPYPEGEPDYLVADSVIRKEADLIDVIAMYDAMREASKRRGRVTPRSDDDPAITFDLGSGFTDTDVYQIKRERLPLFRMLKSFCIYAPYQLISCLLAFRVLGRISGEQKAAQSIFFLAEAIVPGYSNDWNFRDKGLQLSKNKLKPLSVGKWKEPFLPTAPVANEIDKLARQWTSQRKLIESEIQPICFQGKILESHRWWVYRPYYFVNSQTPEGAKWFLLDGQFGTIAGMPGAEEVMKVTRRDWKKLDLRSVRSFEVKVVPFRCPNCGWDVKLQKGEYQLCGNCTRLLEVDREGLAVVPYRIFRPEHLSWWPKAHKGPRVWLPFWRLRPSMLFGKRRYDDLADLLSQILPGIKVEENWHSFFIPAFECWTIAKYDHWSFQFGTSLSQIADVPEDSLLQQQKNANDFVMPLNVPKELSAALFPEILPMFLPSRIHARLNTLLINRFEQTAVVFQEQELVYVPAPIFQATGNDPKVQGPKGVIDWTPMKDGNWPPILQRTVRRWRAMGESAPKQISAKGRFKWLTSPL
jgi:hypothetical protein